MKVVGIVAEYNPFHNGHALHMRKAREIAGSPHVVVVMSGNFVQRGEPAVVDKLCRAKMALCSGADLIIELPVFYATASAEFFARGAVSLLDATGVVTDICFGSECGQIAPLRRMAELLAQESGAFRRSLKTGLDKGLSFPVARQAALAETECPAVLIESPNNILAVCYLKALAELESGITAHTIMRDTAPHHQRTMAPAISSATAIRLAIARGQLEALAQAMPEDCLGLLNEQLKAGRGPAQLGNLSSLFHYIIKTNGRQWLKNIQDVTEGLENRIMDISGQIYHINDIIAQIKTKRYTFTKIQRIVLHCLLNINQEAFAGFEKHGGPQYIRVLGFRKSKAFLLGEMEQKARLPLVTNLKHAPRKLDELGMSMLKKEAETTDVYYMSTDGYKNDPCPQHVEYSLPMVIV